MQENENQKIDINMHGRQMAYEMLKKSLNGTPDQINNQILLLLHASKNLMCQYAMNLKDQHDYEPQMALAYIQNLLADEFDYLMSDNVETQYYDFN